MASVRAYCVITQDDHYQSLAQGLVSNFGDHGISVEVETVRLPRARTQEDRVARYRMKDQHFVRYARSHTSATWLLDAEVRLIRPPPQEWLSGDQSVWFQLWSPRSHWHQRINTGHSIVHPSALAHYESAMRQAEQAIVTSGHQHYNVEHYLTPSHLLPAQWCRLCEDREAPIQHHGQAVRGTWLESEAVIAHPFLINDWMILTEHQPSQWPTISRHPITHITRWTPRTPTISQTVFVNHFAPTDRDLAITVKHHMVRGGGEWSAWATDHREIGDTLDSSVRSRCTASVMRQPCYLIHDWWFAPSIKRTAPRNIWPHTSWLIENFHI